MREMRQQIPKETNVPFTPPATHSQEGFFLIGIAFANVFFNREANCSLLEASIQRCILNKCPKLHKPQISTVQLLSFLLCYCPACGSRYPQLLASKLFKVHTVSPEQHHGTEQAEIQPESKVATNAPKVWFCYSFCYEAEPGKPRLLPSSPRAGCNQAASHQL